MEFKINLLAVPWGGRSLRHLHLRGTLHRSLLPSFSRVEAGRSSPCARNSTSFNCRPVVLPSRHLLLLLRDSTRATTSRIWAYRLDTAHAWVSCPSEFSRLKNFTCKPRLNLFGTFIGLLTTALQGRVNRSRVEASFKLPPNPKNQVNILALV